MSVPPPLLHDEASAWRQDKGKECYWNEERILGKCGGDVKNKRPEHIKMRIQVFRFA